MNGYSDPGFKLKLQLKLFFRK